MMPVKDSWLWRRNGGHIFPALPSPRPCRSEGWDVTWLGTQHGWEGKIVPSHDIEMDSIDFAGLRGNGLCTCSKAVSTC